ncbi:MAG TPA: HNH endonuclease signature motif containing protein, partial [Acidimicrobiales bacterium]
ETEQQRAEKIQKNRSFRIGSNGDGSSWFHGVGPTAEVARLEAALKPLLNDIFQDARQEGRREPVDAYTFDALMVLADRPRPAPTGTTADTAPATNGTNSSTPVVSDSDGWSFAKVIVRADLAALDRGHTEAGELCEIAGHGPVPVADVWKIIDGGAFIAGIATNGTQIDRVRHYGRHPTVLQRTVLEWETAGTCAVEGCTNAVRTEIDHTEPWATTHVTQIGDLAAICTRCHHLKTHRGYTLGPRLPTGKRQLIPPGECPAGAPPDAPSEQPGDAPVADGPDEPERPGLFDTG